MDLFRRREDAGSMRVRCENCGYEQTIEKGVLSVFCKRCMNRIVTSKETNKASTPIAPVHSATPQSGKKKQVTCEECGTLNEVNPDAVSVFCRKCQQIIYLKRDAPAIRSIGSGSDNGRTRAVTCYSCSNVQSVSMSALSAFCSSCGNRIELKDMEVSGMYHEKIMTRGELHVSRSGNVRAEINVMSARVDGEIHGNVFAEDKLVIGSSGKVFGNIIAKRMELQPGAFYSGNVRLNADNIMK
jgi:ribosomal protein S27E